MSKNVFAQITSTLCIKKYGYTLRCIVWYTVFTIYHERQIFKYSNKHGRFARWSKWRACDIGEAKEGLENELWRRSSDGKVWEWAVRRWSNGRVGEWAATQVKRRKGWRMSCDVGKTTEELEKELWRRWNDGNVGTFPSLHLRYSSFPNPSVALLTSQLILQPFRCFTSVTAHSPTLLSLLLLHRLFTYVTWQAAHGNKTNTILSYFIISNCSRFQNPSRCCCIKATARPSRRFSFSDASNSGSRFLHFPTVDGCNDALKSRLAHLTISRSLWYIIAHAVHKLQYVYTECFTKFYRQCLSEFLKLFGTNNVNKTFDPTYSYVVAGVWNIKIRDKIAINSAINRHTNWNKQNEFNSHT